MERGALQRRVFGGERTSRGALGDLLRGGLPVYVFLRTWGRGSGSGPPGWRRPFSRGKGTWEDSERVPWGATPPPKGPLQGEIHT